MAADGSPWWRLHLWEIVPARDVAAVGLFCFVIYVIRELSAVTIPIALAFGAAYALEPAVQWTVKRWHWARWVSSVALLTTVTSALVGVSIVLGPSLVTDTRGLLEQMTRRLDELDMWIQSTLPPSWGAYLGSSEDWLEPSGAVTGGLDALNAAMTFVAISGYLLAATVFTMMMFVFFSTKMPQFAKAIQWVPKSQRRTTLALAKRFEATFGAYFRGQAVVALFTTLGFAIGFSIAGVPSALTIAVIGGLFSFIPNGQAIGPLLAILLGLSSPETPVSAAVAYPLIVYVITQSAETFVVTPLVQSSNTRLPTAWVLGALIAGASVGGVLGVFLAIPVAGCVRIAIRQVVAPRLKAYVDRT